MVYDWDGTHLVRRRRLKLAVAASGSLVLGFCVAWLLT